MSHEPYTEEKLAFLRTNGANMTTRELTEALNRTFSSHHSPGSVRTTLKNIGVFKSASCRSRIARERGASIGSTKIVGGYRYIKVSSGDGNFWKSWKREIVVEWEKLHGPIPEGHMVVTLDGNCLNAAPDNLLCIPKAIAARMTNGHGKALWSEFPEVTITAIELCRLDETIRGSIEVG